jgi:hypothetical protein
VGPTLEVYRQTAPLQPQGPGGILYRMSAARGGTQARRTLAATAAILLELAIIAFLLLLLSVVLTGGGVFYLADIRIRARSANNPVWILTALLVARYALEVVAIRPRISPLARMLNTAASWLNGVASGARSICRRPVALVLGLAVATFIIKVIIAWSSPGFFSGDDVEIHEMSIGLLLGQRWSVWELRSAFFPLTFVYPAQWLAQAAGAAGPEALVLAGRTSVAFFSTAALPLTWLAARRSMPAAPHVASLAVIFLAVNKLFISFGSSELPRPVSTVFVVGAFLLMLRPAMISAMAAGLLLGIATAFRFSEVVFVAAAAAPLALSGQWRRALCLALSAIVCAAAVTALADLLYWGSPLSSALAAVDYTLVQRQSSRGYQPAWAYVRIIPAWSTPLIVALAVAGSSRRHPDSWWLWMPITVLSVLPHKESRYLIPVIPFLSIAAARGLVRVVAWARVDLAPVGIRRGTRSLLAPLLILSLLHDAGGWRLGRADEGIRLARYLRESGGPGIAAEDFWTLGGRPYMWQQDPLLNLDSAMIADRTAFEAALADKQWVAVHPRSLGSGAETLLHSLRFARDPSWSGEDYVLYRRER